MLMSRFTRPSPVQTGWTPADADIFASIWGGSSSSWHEAGCSSSGSGEDGGGRGARASPPSLLVLNKCDLAGQGGSCSGGGGSAGWERDAAAAGEAGVAYGVPPHVRSAFSAVARTSAATGEGLEALRSALLRLSGAPELAPGGVGWSVNARQAEALLRAAEALARAQESVAQGLPVDFWTIDLREAAVALGEVSGDEITEEVLGSIFSRFCIGK